MARGWAHCHQTPRPGDRLVIMAGVPFGVSGSTNVLHVVKVTGDELETYTGPAEI
jgi:pyruvate kinase